jgi:serine beta-lactamase-like protein LACTB
MDTPTARTESWLTPLAGSAAVILGLVIVAVGALLTVNSSNESIHPVPEGVMSVPGFAPAPRWGRAVEQGRLLARAALTEQNLPGMSVAVGVAGEIVWAEGFGWADLTSRASVDARTRFRIGHVSKALTSAGVGLLREQGRLHLDEEIHTYVPTFPGKPWPMTVRQLMGHTAGIGHYRDTEWGDKPKAHCDRAVDGLRSFADAPLLFEPGTEYRYSTYGWVLVSAAVEAAANEPFFRFMRDRIFAPFGMGDTEEDVVSAAQPNRATSYYRGNFGRELTTDVDYSCFAGAGAFLSTPSDLVRFAAALTGGTFVQPATVDLLQAPQMLASGASTNYGLGWMFETIELGGESTRVVGHASRTIEGASASFLTFPERGLAVAVTANMSFADMKSVAMGIARVFSSSGG